MKTLDFGRPRMPTLAEVGEIAEASAIVAGFDRHSFEWEDHYQRVINSSVAVFDRYMPDCPGWHGKVAVIIWGSIEIVGQIRWTADGAEYFDLDIRSEP